ncbi:MAG: ThiF family adenylyltransferase [Gemmatimonadales bacterium]|jgi:molybdopterin/thiamine biosynthesis adenylyltransferase
MNTLVFVDNGLNALRERLLASELETAAFVLARPVAVDPESWRLLVTDTVFVSDTDYTSRSGDRIELPPSVVAAAVKRARNGNQSVIVAHTHPWEGPVEPSFADREGEKLLVPMLRRRVRGVPHGRLILGRRDTHAALIFGNDNEASLDVVQLGTTVVRPPRLQPGGRQEPTFDRQARLFGPEAQAILSDTRVAIVGLGGTGSTVAQQLAYLGVRDFILIDFDVLDPTNLNRVIGATANDVGRPKVEVAGRMIKALAPSAVVREIKDDVTKAKVAREVLKAAFFFCCTDSHGSRAVLTQLSSQYWVPGVDLGVRIDVSQDGAASVVGRVQMLAPGLPCLSCSGVLDPEQVRRDLMTDAQRAQDPYIVGAHVPQPAVISFNVTAGGFAVTMFLAALIGTPGASRYQLLRFDAGVVKSIACSPDPQCAVCSRGGFFGRADTWPAPGRPEAAVGSQ